MENGVAPDQLSSEMQADQDLSCFHERIYPSLAEQEL